MVIASFSAMLEGVMVVFLVLFFMGCRVFHVPAPAPPSHAGLAEVIPVVMEQECQDVALASGIVMGQFPQAVSAWGAYAQMVSWSWSGDEIRSAMFGWAYHRPPPSSMAFTRGWWAVPQDWSRLWPEQEVVDSWSAFWWYLNHRWPQVAPWCTTQQQDRANTARGELSAQSVLFDVLGTPARSDKIESSNTAAHLKCFLVGSAVRQEPVPADAIEAIKQWRTLRILDDHPGQRVMVRRWCTSSMQDRAFSDEFSG